jgi:uncharacterized protein YeeX (DUF496 family)
MCDEPRVFTTSFRYSSVVQNVLDSIQGKTTADKIEFICLDYVRNKLKRENQIKDLDKQIADKRKLLDELSNKIWKVKDVSSSLENLVNSLKKCNT